MPDYTTYTTSELIEAQSQISAQTGEDINGILGGLPVASQNQEYFVVFDEAGSTGPEILNKTQFRITYLVDSNLNTSKPTEEGDAALNATQNFEKSKPCMVRADNATVLNQNLTGKQAIYDIGSLQLISTTEWGVGNDEYATTMSFNGVGGQLIGIAQNIGSSHRQSNPTANELTSDGNQNIQLTIPITAVSESDGGGYDWVEWNGEEYEFLQSTLEAGTRLKVSLGFSLQVNNVFAGNSVVVTVNLYRDPIGAQPPQLLDSIAYGSTVPNNPVAPQNFIYNGGNLLADYQDFADGDRIYAEIVRSGGATEASTTVFLKTCIINFIQETPSGDILTIGLNATTSSYWDGVTTISGSNVNPNDLNNAYSVLTASADLSLFSNGDYIQVIPTASEAFDPENDGNTFNPIQLPFTFETGDEIRFEYNVNKVHKVIKTELDDENRTLLYIKPGVNTQEIGVFNDVSIGTQLNHFTHYRIIKNGGYLFINAKKDNIVGIEQDFKGIITPYFPSENLQSKGDRLIYELKQAGIIEI